MCFPSFLFPSAWNLCLAGCFAIYVHYFSLFFLLLLYFVLSFFCPQVPKRHVWIQGDNIYASRDSRHFGPVPYGLIEGKVFFRVTVVPHTFYILMYFKDWFFRFHSFILEIFRTSQFSWVGLWVVMILLC